MRVLTLLDRGVRDAHELNGDPALQAELYRTLGGIYQQLGNLDRADSLFSASLAAQRVLGEADRAGMAKSLVALGLLRGDQSRYEESDSLVRAGLALTRGLSPPGGRSRPPSPPPH